MSHKYVSLDENNKDYGIAKDSPYSVYRFMQEESHVDLMLKGNIYLSTMNICRRRENLERGDLHEGYSFFSSGVHSGKLSDPHMQTVANRLGVEIGHGSEGTGLFAWCSSSSRLRDSYLLCTTTTFNPAMCKEFGKYCIKIDHVPHFYMVMSRLLSEQFGVGHGIAGHAIYNDRMYEGIDDPPSPPTSVALLKPSRQKHQREYRFSWNPVPARNLEPITVFSEELKSFFTRIS